MFELLPLSYLYTLALSPIAVIAFTRMFMIGHDCSHRSFVSGRWQNIVIGNLIGILVNTPLLYWGSPHAAHHRTTGNMDKGGTGDVETLNVEEFAGATDAQQAWYRIGRNPWVLMFIFAPIHFLIMQRFPLEQKSASTKIWRSVMLTNVGIAVHFGTMIWIFGLTPFLMVYSPVVLLSSTVAVWLFYVQHQFDDAYWKRDEAWDYEDATTQGSSFYDLPRWLHWSTGNIGYHHIHHLNPRVPNYRLCECYESSPVLQEAKTIGFLESFRLARLALWDEANSRLISFKEYGERAG